MSVSRGALEQSERSGVTDIARGKSDEVLRHEVEAETLVLQRRVAELSATLERMDAELREVTAAREAAERSAKASPPPPSELDPWLVSLALALVALALAAMLVRSRRGSGLAVPAFARMGEPIYEDMPTALGSGTDMTPPDAPPRARATAAAVARNLEADTPTEEEDSFDEELVRYAEQSSSYSVLEREQPKVVTALIRDWGKPKVIAYLRELIVAPRKGARPFSPEAVSDLIFLQSLAMEHAGYGSEENPWQVELGERQKRIA